MIDVSIERIIEAVSEHPTKKAAADALGLKRTTLRDRLKAYHKREAERADLDDEIDFPNIPADNLTADEILDYQAARQRQLAEHAQAMHWLRIGIRSNEPMGLAFVGDPHLGNNGCNVDLMRRDVALMAETEGVYAVNMGDTVDNWGGRLIRIYAENDISRQSERVLAKWFLQDSGIRWLVWLLGNHDEMDSAFATYLRSIKAKSLPMAEWRAQFKLAFPNGSEVRIDAAHNHKGHSMWNNLHGQDRASRFEEEADIYIAGHHHDWAVAKKEPYPGRVVNLARARGYKFQDHYAHRHQFSEQHFGSTILAVIDPGETIAVRRIRMFEDLQEGCDFLTWKRQKSRSATTSPRSKKSETHS